MKKDNYEKFEALNPFFDIVLKGLKGLVEGDHFFETIADDATLEFVMSFRDGQPGFGVGRGT